ncbi:MAG TPA: hypothetical protein ENI57_05850 [Ignavibacteria bacterium]|nr:hypothetical protein [Ignavibacteria bacterium]
MFIESQKITKKVAYRFASNILDPIAQEKIRRNKIYVNQPALNDYKEIEAVNKKHSFDNITELL